jgi:hypothetical protein
MIDRIHDIPDFHSISRNLHCFLAFPTLYSQSLQYGFPCAFLCNARACWKARTGDRQVSGIYLQIHAAIKQVADGKAARRLHPSLGQYF